MKLVWRVSLLGSICGCIGCAISIIAALKFGASRTSCGEHDSNSWECDEEIAFKTIVMIFMKLPTIVKTYHYQVFQTNPDNRTVQLDGYWRVIRPCCLRYVLSTAFLVGGMLTVPFQFVIELPIKSFVMGAIGMGLVLLPAIYCAVDAWRGSLRLAAAWALLETAGMIAHTVCLIFAVAAALFNDFLTPLPPAMTQPALPLCLVMELGAQAHPFFMSACMGRRGRVIVESGDADKDAEAARSAAVVLSGNEAPKKQRFLFNSIEHVAELHPNLLDVVTAGDDLDAAEEAQQRHKRRLSALVESHHGFLELHAATKARRSGAT